MPMYEGKANSRGLTPRMIEEREQEEYRRHMMGAWGGPMFAATHTMLDSISRNTVTPEPPKEPVLPVIRSNWDSRHLEDYIDRIIQNGDATIVIWKDTSKTVVKRAADEDYNLYAAVAQAVMKKFMGSTSHAHKVIRKKVVVQKPKEPKVMKAESVPAQVMEAVFEEIRAYEGEANEAND